LRHEVKEKAKAELRNAKARLKKNGGHFDRMRVAVKRRDNAPKLLDAIKLTLIEIRFYVRLRDLIVQNEILEALTNEQ
jgi:hypothetical protein